MKQEDISRKCNEAKALVGAGDVEQAIDVLQEVARTANATLDGELSSIRARLSYAIESEQNSTWTTEFANVERNKIVRQIIACADKLTARPSEQVLYRELSPREIRSRRDYLAALKADVENRLKVSIHNAWRIDLGLKDTPGAVNLPWIFRDVTTEQTFSHFDDAVEAYRRRLLVLGSPGSGKTVTFLNFAKKLVEEAERDDGAPVPLLTNLSKLNIRPAGGGVSRLLNRLGAEPEQEARQIERWLQRELSAYPFISSEVARNWIAEGRIAALLDGLDEVDDGYRSELTSLLNETYLRDYPNSIVIVCSRINEYLPIQQDKSATLQLDGSITLQPLTREQISAYLHAAGADSLRSALVEDETLYQMAQTPLMLSMLTFVYAGADPTVVPSSGSSTDRRYELMTRYVERMLQRRARRDAGMPFDNNPKNDIAIERYPYTPDRSSRYLGWLALRMSVRMQTTISPRLMLSFLEREIDRDRLVGIRWTVAFARSSILIPSIALAAAAVAPPTFDAWKWIGGVTLFAMLLYPLLRSIIFSDSATGRPWIFRQAQEIVASMLVAAAFLFPVGFVAVHASIALSLLLPGHVPPIAIAILTCSILAASCFATVSLADRKPVEGLFVAVSLSATLLVTLVHFAFGPVGWILAAVLIGAAQLGFVAVWIWREERSVFLAGSVIFLGGVLSFVVVKYAPSATSPFPALDWALLLLALSVLLADCLLEDTFYVVLVAMAVSVFCIGSVTAGLVGAVLALLGFGIVLVYVTVVKGVASSIEFRALSELNIWLRQLAERFLFSPTILFFMSLRLSLPLRFAAFSSYGVDCLILKWSGSDLEFMHRLLRDHFAIRLLLPAIATRDGAARIQAIRNLGFQGDAAINLLADYVRSSDPSVREAAAWALGRIASPEIVQHVDVALEDEVTAVRIAAVSSTGNMVEADRERLLLKIANDDNIEVQRAFVTVMLEHSFFYSQVSEETEPSTGEVLRRKVFGIVDQRESIRSYLAEVISNPEQWRMHLAAISISRILKIRATVPALMTALRRDSFLAEFAANALTEIGDPIAVNALRRACYSRHKEVRGVARDALKKFGVDPSGIDRWWFIGYVAEQAGLGRFFSNRR